MAKKTTNVKKDFYSLLKKEHTMVKDELQKIIEKKSDAESTFIKVRDALSIHMEGEEKLFYPSLIEEEKTRMMILEAYEEHKVGKALLRDLDATDKGTEIWFAKVKVLLDVLTHHIDEEEKEMFPEAKEILEEEKSMDIAQKFTALKNERTASGPAHGTSGEDIPGVGEVNA
jgi:hemerythrin-like domain-containing protein